MVRRESTQTAGDGNNRLDGETEGEKQSDQQGVGQNQQWDTNNEAQQGMNNGAFGMDSATGFPTMGLNGMGDYNSMMQMMPNGMPNPMMGAFPNMMGKRQM